MRFRALASLVFASTVTTAAACSSVPDVTFSDDGGASSSSGGTDAGPDVFIDPNCKKTGAEVCDDGIDNDCNGLPDCADPACTAGFACADTAPSGWNLVAFSAAAPPNCPTGYGAPTDLKVVTGDGSGGACACSCDPSGGQVAKCSDSKYIVGLGSGTCNTTILNNLTSNTNGTCTPFGTPPTITTVSGIVSASNGPTACTPNVVKNVQPLTDGRQCAPPPKVGKGCPGTQVCVPKPTGMQVCAMKAGSDACPAPYTTQRRAGTSGTVDNRACNDCTGKCAAPTPCTGSLTLYGNAMCNTGMGASSAQLTLGAACTALTDFGGNGKANAYQATLSGGCGTPAAFDTAVTGSIAFAGQETVCCKQ